MPNIPPGTHAPLRLGAVLVWYGLSQGDLADRIRQPTGRPLSRVAVNQLINHGVWPRTTDRTQIIGTTEAMLRQAGADEDDLVDIWEIDPAHPIHQGNPAHRRTLTPRPEAAIDSEIREMLHPATKKHFGLSRDPFQNDVLSSDDVYLPLNYREVRESMLWAARNGSLMAIIGESGAGKSVIMRDVVERLDADEEQRIVTIQPRVIDKTRLNANMITEAIIYDLMPDAKIRRSSEGKERQAQTLIRDAYKAGKQCVLVIEEAHDISVHVLKLLKRYWEIVAGHRHLLGIILVAQPELQAKLDAYRYEARELINRLEVNTLAPLGADLEGYLEKKFRRAGKSTQDILAPDVCDMLRLKLRRDVGKKQVSVLYPLRVNVDITRAMNKAADLGMPIVTAQTIESLYPTVSKGA